MMDNLDRVKRAVGALDQHRKALYGEGARYEPLDQSLTDLLADLLHWCDVQSIDFDDCLRIARHHYTAETGT